MAKRYYWLKLPDGFFRQKAIKKLRKIAGGDTYTIIYLKMLLVAMKQDGRLEIESKKEMKKRGLDSPDRADALALALYLGKIKKHTGTAPGVKELQELTKDNYWG